MAYLAPEIAGKERRIAAVVHPQMLAMRAFGGFLAEQKRTLAQVEHGSQSLAWYLLAPLKAVRAKLVRKYRAD
jgi:hypothetical protein